MSELILIVEDDVEIRELLAEMLADAGYRVEVAANGAEGLQRLAGERPCVVILDLMMPVMDGFAVLEHMRSDFRLQDVPVVVVTAKTLTSEDREMLRGARAILERNAYTRRELVDIVAKRVREVLQQG
jgi:CheY-like chemotaxis protein